MAGNNNDQQAAENAVGHPAAVPARQQKRRSAWTGVRFRQGGRWAAEIRVPRTKERIWIGVFEKEWEAALAYDAAVFCFHGENPPPRRKFNFPAAPRPGDIPEDVRAHLTIVDIKYIAKNHAMTAAGRLLPPPPPANTMAAEPEPLQVAALAPAAGAAPPPASIYHGLNHNPVDIDLSLGTGSSQ